VVKAPTTRKVPVATTPPASNAPPIATAAPVTPTPLPVEATVATSAGDTPPADNPASAATTLPATPDPPVSATQVPVVVDATIPNRATPKPKPTKVPKTIPRTLATLPSTGATAVEVVNPSDFSVEATAVNPVNAVNAVGTPSGERSAASSVVPTSTKVAKTSKATKTTSSTVSLPARAATTPTLGDSGAAAAKPVATSSEPGAANPTAPTAATGSAEIVFETALPATDTLAPASTKKSGKPGSKANTPSTTPKIAVKPDPAVTTPAVATATAATAISPNLAEPTLPEPTLPPTVAPTTTKRPKPTTTTTTILLSPDTVPASDIEVSVDGVDGSTEQGTDQSGNADPSTTRKKRPSITDVLEGTTIVPNPSIPAATKPVASSDPAATSVEAAVAPTTVEPEAPAVTNPSATKPPAADDRPRTEAEIVSGTDAGSPDAADATPDLGSSLLPQASASSLKAGRLRGPLKLAGAGALAALLLGLTGLFASLRAPITAFARQRLLNGFGLGLALIILTLAAIAIARELLNTPRSWARVALKGLGFAALTAFAFVRRRSMKRGLSVVSEALPSAKNVRVHSSVDGVAASRELDEQLPKSLRLGDATGQRAKGRHIPELVRRLRKASLVEAIFGAIALLVAAVLLFV
jgi:hypothetical protein